MPGGAGIVVDLLIFLRISGYLFAGPLVSSTLVPSTLRVGLAILLTFVLAPVTAMTAPTGSVPLIIAGAGELLLGLAMGYVGNLVFSVTAVAGGLLDVEVGFALGQTLNPAFGGAASTVSQNFLLVIFSLLFLITGGLELSIVGLGASLRLVPDPVVQTGPVAALVTRFTGAVIATGVLMALPMLVLIFVLNLVLAVLSRFAPQLNVFALGLSIQPALGIIGLLLALPILVEVMTPLISGIERDVFRLLQVVR